jgi:hypothetical protein
MDEGLLTMSGKERERASVVRAIAAGRLGQAEGAERWDLRSADEASGAGVARGWRPGSGFAPARTE